MPLGQNAEPFYAVLDVFENSRITAFEVDEDVCAKLNSESRENVTFYPQALGKSEGEQAFYITHAPMRVAWLTKAS